MLFFDVAVCLLNLSEKLIICFKFFACRRPIILHDRPARYSRVGFKQSQHWFIQTETFWNLLSARPSSAWVYWTFPATAYRSTCCSLQCWYDIVCLFQRVIRLVVYQLAIKRFNVSTSNFIVFCKFFVHAITIIIFLLFGKVCALHSSSPMCCGANCI